MEIDSITKENPLKLCFVCLGNICRSPTAEGIFQHLVNERNLEHYFEVDSAGTSAYHIGEKANSNSREVASRHGIELHSRARRFDKPDLEYFDLIIAMDRENIEHIKRLGNQISQSDKLYLMRHFDPGSDQIAGELDVPDPYMGGMSGFEHVFDVLHRSCRKLLAELEENIVDESSSD